VRENKTPRLIVKARACHLRGLCEFVHHLLCYFHRLERAESPACIDSILNVHNSTFFAYFFGPLQIPADIMLHLPQFINNMKISGRRGHARSKI
jgi:hypothetical protein